MSRLSLLCVLATFSIVQVVQCQSVADYNYPSFCPKLKLGDFFDLPKWRGWWYQKRHSKDMLWTCSDHFVHHEDGQKDLKCTSRLLFLNGTVDYVDSIIRVEKHAEPIGTSLTLYDKYMHFEVFFVLDTDYETYSIEYGCYDMGGMKYEYVWLMNRDIDTDVSPELVQRTKDIMKENGIEIELNDKLEDCKEFYRVHTRIPAQL